MVVGEGRRQRPRPHIAPHAVQGQIVGQADRMAVHFQNLLVGHARVPIEMNRRTHLHRPDRREAPGSVAILELAPGRPPSAQIVDLPTPS